MYLTVRELAQTEISREIKNMKISMRTIQARSNTLYLITKKLGKLQINLFEASSPFEGESEYVITVGDHSFSYYEESGKLGYLTIGQVLTEAYTNLRGVEALYILSDDKPRLKDCKEKLDNLLTIMKLKELKIIVDTYLE